MAETSSKASPEMAVTVPDTIVCSSCWTVMPAASHFCSACGAQVSSTVTGSQRMAALLSEANLYRMRARWLDAENRCIEAIRLDSQSVDAHSLLGDIYRDQSKLEDAAQWYHLALDLDPNSLGDRAKLAEVEKQLSKKAIPTPGVVKPVTPIPTPYGTQKLLGLPSNAWLQVITAVAVIFVVVVIAIALSMGRGRTAAKTDGGSQAQASSSSTSTFAGAGQIAEAPAPRSARVSQVPTAVPVVPGGAQTARALDPPLEPLAHPDSIPLESEEKPSAPRETVNRTVLVGATDYERNLRRFIAARAKLGADSSVGHITVDPRHPRASLVVSIAPRQMDQTAVSGIVIRAATRVATAALAADSALNTITVNVRLKSGTERYIPIFAADADRSAVSSLPENPSINQMLAGYSSYWWAPGFAPPGLPQSVNNADSAP